jgi:hypothetical protein
MNKRWIAPLVGLACVSAVMWFGVAARAGQASRTPAATYKAPRTPDGKPDLQGFWQSMNTAAWNIEDHTPQKGVPGGQAIVEGHEIPYRPEALQQRNENYARRATADPEAHCYLPGVPRITYMPFPLQIIQTPATVSIAYEYLHTYRLIYTNGSEHKKDIDFWMGDSRGHWEGETLVVDVTDLNDQTWFDRAGNFHSGELHVVERYTRTGPDTLRYEATIEDPKVFTRPWKMSMPLYRHQEVDFQLLEYECYAYALDENSDGR